MFSLVPIVYVHPERVHAFIFVPQPAAIFPLGKGGRAIFFDRAPFFSIQNGNKNGVSEVFNGEFGEFSGCHATTHRITSNWRYNSSPKHL